MDNALDNDPLMEYALDDQGLGEGYVEQNSAPEFELASNDNKPEPEENSRIDKVSGFKIVSNMVEMDPSDIINRPQVRTQFDEASIQELSDSLALNGQYQPIIVSGPNKDKKHTILVGERRWRAAKLAGIKLSVVIQHEEESELDLSEEDIKQSIRELTENLQREDLASMDIAMSLHELKSNGLSQLEIATQIAKSEMYVSTHLKLLELPGELKTFVEDKDVKDLRLINDLRREYTKDPEAVTQFIEDHADEDINRNLVTDFKIAKNENTSKPVLVESEEPEQEEEEEEVEKVTKPNINNVDVIVKMEDGTSGVIDLSRFDGNPGYIYVSSGSDTHRVEASTITIVGMRLNKSPKKKKQK
jgi:ParB family transcriptional regulator, chromosome partitioning protein